MKFDLSKYSDKQVVAAQLLNEKDQNHFTNERIADECKIDARTLYRWLHDDDFLELLNYFAEQSMEGFTPELYQQLRKAVRNGSTRALELALKNRGKLIDRKEVSGGLEIGNSAEGLDNKELLNEIEALKAKVSAIAIKKASDE